MSYNHREIQREEIIKFVRGLDQSKSYNVLEIGAGGGNEQDLFRNNLKVSTYIMIDKENRQYIDLQMDAHDMSKFPDNTFDIIFASHTFEHLTDPIKALKECLRILTPKGTLFFITPFACEKQILHADADHLFCLTEMQWRKLLLHVGFTKVKTYNQYITHDEQIDNEQNYMTISQGVKQ